MLAFRRLIDAIEAEGSAALVTLAAHGGLEPARNRGAHGRPAFGRISWNYRRRGAGMGGARGGANRAATGTGTGDAPFAGAGPGAGAMLRRPSRMADRDFRSSGPASTRCRSRRRRRGDRRRSRRALEAMAGSSGCSKGAGAGRGCSEAKLKGRAGPSRSGKAPIRSICLAPAMSDARSRLRLRRLPFVVRWINSRREAFPDYAPANVALIHAPEPSAELASAPDGALIVVMTHSHRDRSRDRRRCAAVGALRLCRTDRLRDQTGAIPEPDARGRTVGNASFEARLPDRLAAASQEKNPR